MDIKIVRDKRKKANFIIEKEVHFIIDHTHTHTVTQTWFYLTVFCSSKNWFKKNQQQEINQARNEKTLEHSK